MQQPKKKKNLHICQIVILVVYCLVYMEVKDQDQWTWSSCFLNKWQFETC